jgi:hypothetical protein
MSLDKTSRLEAEELKREYRAAAAVKATAAARLNPRWPWVAQGFDPAVFGVTAWSGKEVAVTLVTSGTGLTAGG